MIEGCFVSTALPAVVLVWHFIADPAVVAVIIAALFMGSAWE